MEQQILIIGPNLKSCKELKYTLKRHNQRTYYTLSVTDGIQHMIRYGCHLVIMDTAAYADELLYSLDLIRRVHLVPIFILSPHGESQFITKCLSIADDFLQKPFDMNVCVAKVGALLRRYTYSDKQQSPGVLSHDGKLVIDARRRRVYFHEIEIRLQRKQYELLYLMASNEGRVFTREQLQQNVWGDDFTGSENTLSNQIAELRNKMKSPVGTSECIQTNYGIGYCFDTNSL